MEAYQHGLNVAFETSDYSRRRPCKFANIITFKLLSQFLQVPSCLVTFRLVSIRATEDFHDYGPRAGLTPKGQAVHSVPGPLSTGHGCPWSSMALFARPTGRSTDLTGAPQDRKLAPRRTLIFCCVAETARSTPRKKKSMLG